MKQIAIIGLDSFGVWVLEELLQLEVEILIVDKDPELVNEYRDQVQAAYVADATREEVLNQIVPQEIDAVILDLGDRIESSALAANYLKKMGVRRIIAKIENDEHGKILDLVGATEVIYPDREAAKRLMPPLLSDTMFNYMPISEGLVMAEVSLPEEDLDSTIIDAGIRTRYGLNVVAVKPTGIGEFVFVSPQYRIEKGDRFLVAGSNEDIASLSQDTDIVRSGWFGRFFRSKKGS